MVLPRRGILSDSFDNNSIGFALWIRQNAYGGNPCGYGDFRSIPPSAPSFRSFGYLKAQLVNRQTIFTLSRQTAK